MRKSLQKLIPLIALIIILTAKWFDIELPLGTTLSSSDAIPTGGPQSYRYAKKHLRTLYSGPGTTLYCTCRYNSKRHIDPTNCGLPPDLSNSERSLRVEWEHVVPASEFGATFAAWAGHPKCGRRRGRSCARKVSRLFNRMEANLYNLRPSVGSVNSLRGNRVMQAIPGQSYQGRCTLKVQADAVEPRDEIKGDIARIYLYMNKTYPDRNIIRPEQYHQYLLWDQQDPVDRHECTLARKIAPIQEHTNEIVESRCRQAGL